MMNRKTDILFLVFLVGITPLIDSCKTKGDVVRENQYRRMQFELKNSRSSQAEYEQETEELKIEVSRLNSLMENQSQRLERMARRMENYVARIERLERTRTAPVSRPSSRSDSANTPTTLGVGKALFDKGDYAQAAVVLKRLIKRGSPKSTDTKRARFLLAESYFANRDFALAALEYANFKRVYPSDSLVPRAIYRQANSFRAMGKRKEAKLFYQELIDRFPKSSLVSKAKKELRSLR